MKQMYDRYDNIKRKGEGLILKAGDPIPEAAVPSEWKKRDTVDASKLNADDKADIDKHNYRLIKIKSETTITEGVKPPK